MLHLIEYGNTGLCPHVSPLRHFTEKRVIEVIQLIWKLKVSAYQCAYISSLQFILHRLCFPHVILKYWPLAPLVDLWNIQSQDSPLPVEMATVVGETISSLSFRRKQILSLYSVMIFFYVILIKHFLSTHGLLITSMSTDTLSIKIASAAFNCLSFLANKIYSTYEISCIIKQSKCKCFGI